MNINQYFRNKFKKKMPNIPTDNLYKFGFVGSLFLLSFFIYNLVKIIENNSNKEFQIDLNSKILEIEHDHIADQYQFVGEIFKSNPSVEVANMAKNRLDSLDEHKKQFKMKEATQNNVNKNFLDRKIYYFFYIGTFIFMAIVSVISTVLFGRFWYLRVQKIEDEILKNNLKKFDSKM